MCVCACVYQGLAIITGLHVCVRVCVCASVYQGLASVIIPGFVINVGDMTHDIYGGHDA